MYNPVPLFAEKNIVVIGQEFDLGCFSTRYGGIMSRMSLKTSDLRKAVRVKPSKARGKVKVKA